MSFPTATSASWQDKFAAACDRLVHPQVGTDSERKIHRRMIGLLLATPFFISGLMAQVFYRTVDNGSLLAVICVIFACAWIATAIVAATARTAAVESVLLIVGTLCIGLVISATGLLQSPLVLMLAAPPFECWWLHRSRGRSNKGWWASMSVCAVALVANAGGFAPVREFAVHLWVVPLIYAATMWLRFTGPTVAQKDIESGDEKTFDAAAQISRAAIFRVLSNGEVEYASHMADETFGVPSSLLLSKGLFERIHVTDRVEYLSLIAQCADDGEPRNADLRVRLPAEGHAIDAGNFISLRFQFMPPANENENMLVFVRKDEELAALRKEVATARDQADGMEIAKGRFLASVSHELRTPLNAIIGFADMLKSEMFGPYSDPRQKEYADLIGQSGNHLLSVVNAILDVSKIESGNYLIEPEPFNFADAVDMCHSMMILQAKAKGLTVERDIDPAVGEICADQRAVQQILINLVSNAVKFTPNGGNVRISADIKDDRLRVHVSDTGIGMSAEDLDRIGEPFIQVQTDYTRQYEGTGLGLSLVKGLVALHDGEMSIDSAPNLGTTVSISVPLEGPAGHMEPPGQIDDNLASLEEIQERDVTERKHA